MVDQALTDPGAIPLDPLTPVGLRNLGERLAVDLRDELDVMGFPAVVHSEKRQETIWHRVMVGPYPDEGKALRVRQQLEDRLGTRPFLRRQPL